MNIDANPLNNYQKAIPLDKDLLTKKGNRITIYQVYNRRTRQTKSFSYEKDAASFIGVRLGVMRDAMNSDVTVGPR